MPPDAVTEYQVEYGDSPVYRWTIRVLYATAVGLNVWLLWKMTADDYQRAMVRHRVGQWWHKATAPIRHEQIVRRERNPMLFAAEQIVEGADGA